MGQGGKGWSAARTEIVQPNIRGYDMVFLQEVQWVKKGTKDRFAAPAGYEVVMKMRKEEDRHLCILYTLDKLKCEDDDTKIVTDKLKSIKDWTKYSERLCLQVFTLKEKGNTSKFVAISLHAPRTNSKHFSDVVKAGIEKVVADHKLPVLVGGDFNTDIYEWKNDGFLGLHNGRHKRIDFIVMKFPEKSHLEMGEVLKFENIAIPAAAQDLEVKRKSKTAQITVRQFVEEYLYDFYIHLCDSHMPLTVVVTYHDQCADQEQERTPVKSEAPTPADERMMSWDDILAHLTEYNALIEKVAELGGKCKKYQSMIKELEKEVRDLKERF